MAETNEEVDIAKVNEYVKGLVDTHVQDALKQYQPPVQQQPPQTLSQEQQAQLQLQQLLEPFIAPRVNAAQLTAADARDMSSFYSDSDNLSMKDEVEKMFDELKTAGRAIPRADIKRYLLGKEYEADPIKFTEKQQERRKAQTKGAEAATDFGQGSVERARTDATFGNGNVWTMPLEDLGKSLTRSNLLMALKPSVLEALEMARQLKDKLASLNRTRYTALASTAVEEAIHWLKDESETE